MAPSTLAVFVAALVPSSSVAGAPGDYPAPRYTLSLDTPALDRWAPLMDKVLDAHGWNSSLGVVIDYLQDEVMPLEEFLKVDLELEAVGIALLGPDIIEELRGMRLAAERHRSGQDVSIGMLVFLQFFYELVMECTGILARDASGAVVHGRNMDIDLLLTNLTADVVWMKDGNALMTTTQYIGHAGVHTGMRHGGGWSAQINQRTKLEFGPWGWDKTVVGHNLLTLLMGFTSPCFLLREALLEVPSFTEAVSRLSSARIDSPVYFILAGAGHDEGAVITRSRQGLAPAPANASIKRLSEESFLVETNWDTWIPVDEEECRAMVGLLPEVLDKMCASALKLLFGEQDGCSAICDTFSDGRREAAVRAMQKLVSQGDVSLDSVLEVLSTPPVLASTTTFTSLMRPATDDYRTTVRAREPQLYGRSKFLNRRGLREAAADLLRRLVDLGRRLRLSDGILI